MSENATTCGYCNAPMPKRDESMRGRPREYCDRRCAQRATDDRRREERKAMR